MEKKKEQYKKERRIAEKRTKKKKRIERNEKCIYTLVRTLLQDTSNPADTSIN